MGYRNPLLQLDAVQELMRLPAADRVRLARVLRAIRAQANAEAERSWKLRKAPMASYFRVVSTYSRHIAHAITTAAERRSNGTPC